MAESEVEPDIAAMSFEQALEELERIVQRLEQGRTTLDEAIASYERGAMLKRHCEAKLRDAREKVERISLDSSGEARTEPADLG